MKKGKATDVSAQTKDEEILSPALLRQLKQELDPKVHLLVCVLLRSMVDCSSFSVAFLLHHSLACVLTPCFLYNLFPLNIGL